jgi:hypothetical protein
MPHTTIIELAGLYFVPVAMIALFILGLRPTNSVGGRQYVAIAVALAVGNLMLALLPGFQ